MAVEANLHLRIPDRTLQRARAFALGNDLESAINDLANSGAVLAAFARLNPGAVVGLEVNASNELVHWFLAFDNSEVLYGILPIIFCDGAFAKNAVCPRGILGISALTIEMRVVILAIACVKNENTESWTYTLSKFRQTAIGQLVLGGSVLVVSDRDGGLRAAKRAIFPRAPFLFCILHIIKNAKQAGIRGDFKLLVKIAKAASLAERDRLMVRLNQSSPALVYWLRAVAGLSDDEWQTAPHGAKGRSLVGIVTNNAAEAANSKLLRSEHGGQSLREMTPGPMLSAVIELFSSQARSLRESSRNLVDRSIKYRIGFTYASMRMFMQQQSESRFYDVTERAHGLFVVSRRGTNAVARLVWRNENGVCCDCCFFTQFRVLCRHIIAVFSTLKSREGPLKNASNIRQLLKQGGIGDAWSISRFVKAFGNLHVCSPTAAEVSSDMQQTVFPMNIRLPAPVKQRGRPAKKRIRSAFEVGRAAVIRRAGIADGTRCVICFICSEVGHNMRSCPSLVNEIED